MLYIETQRDIHQCATDELVNAGMDGIHLRCDRYSSHCMLQSLYLSLYSFYLTSIYDHSIFEVWGYDIVYYYSILGV